MPRLALSALFVLAATANAKITNAVTLEQLVKDQPIIFIAKVAEFLPEKPGMILTPVDKLRGEFPFARVPVNLTGDAEAIKEKQPAIVLERIERGLPLVIFANRRGAKVVAVGYTNGTWIRMSGRIEKDGDKEVTRWQFVHCEPYFRRTYKGTTEDLIKVIRGGLKGEKLPAYNEKEKPGYGPPLKKPDAGKEPIARHETEDKMEFQMSPASCLVSPPLGVIQLPFLGLIAALAALFPAVFGGMAVMMRRWLAALSIASVVSILSALVVYFPNWIAWSGIKSVSTMWIIGAVIAGFGALWASRRYRQAIRNGRVDEFQPRYLDRVGLTAFALLASAGVVYALIANKSLRESPWLEALLFFAPASACLYFVLAHRQRGTGNAPPVPVSTETVGLWAGCFACALAGVALMGGPRGPAIVAGGGMAGNKLAEQPLWVFEPKEKGEILATPCVTPERIYVAVHHRQGFDQYGRVYALDPNSGSIVWQFDDDNNLKPLFSSPTCADGKLFFGEGYHTDHDSKLFCLDAASGKKIWDFPTNSHTESSPVAADGRVVVGAGDDGMYCLDAATGQKQWQFPVGGGLHIDSNPVIHDGKVYAGSGTSQKSKNTRIFCVDLKSGQEIWGEKVEYSAWGSPAAAGKQVFFATGNGTFSEDREPIAGMVLCRDAATGKSIWLRALPNSVVGRPAVDRYQVYVGCRDGNCYALDRQTGDIVWSKTLQSPVLASPTIERNPETRVGEVVYAIGNAGQFEALSPQDGSLFWAVSFRNLTEQPYIYAISTPVVVREKRDRTLSRRILVGIGFGPSSAATPTARLYCFLSTSN